jgi:type IV pilus assembly protein PilE
MYFPIFDRQTHRGFTLIELMVVFLIIAVLAAIAYPQYQEYVRQGRRAEAAAALMDGAQKLERYYSAHGKYKDDDGNLAAVFTTQIPASSEANDVYYAIAGVPSDTGYTLTATAKGLMAGDKCGDFSINQAGKQDNTNNSATVAECWRR